MRTDVTRRDDGTFDIVQREKVPGGVFTPETLQSFYWRALCGATLGLVHFRRDSIRILGVGPVLLRFGPMSAGRRPIVGGVFSREPHGAIRWLTAADEIGVEVEKFSPFLKGRLWSVELWLHHQVGRRFVLLAARSVR